MAALTIPKTKAAGDRRPSANAGIKAPGILPMDLNVPDDVVVENVHLSESLMRSVLPCLQHATGKKEEERKARGEL